MDPFSQPTAAAACSALSSKAQFMALTIQLGLPDARAQDELQRQLYTLSTRFQQLAHHADQLGHCVADAGVVHKPLGDVLALSLTKCQDGLGMVTASLDANVPGTDRPPLSRELIAGYEGSVAAYSRLFVLGTQLLIMETEQEQQSTLANPGAANIVQAAHVAFHSLGGGALN